MWFLVDNCPKNIPLRIAHRNHKHLWRQCDALFYFSSSHSSTRWSINGNCKFLHCLNFYFRRRIWRVFFYWWDYNKRWDGMECFGETFREQTSSLSWLETSVKVHSVCRSWAAFSARLIAYLQRWKRRKIKGRGGERKSFWCFKVLLVKNCFIRNLLAKYCFTHIHFLPA